MSYRDFSEDAFKVISEIFTVTQRLSIAIKQKRDPIDALTDLESKIFNLELELSKLLIEKNRTYALHFIKDFYGCTGKGVNIIMPKDGITVKLLSVMSEIVLLIIKKIKNSINLISIESNNGLDISCTLNNLNYEEIIDTPLPKVVSKLDGHIIKKDNNFLQINIPNVFGREKFLIVNSQAGMVAFSMVSILNKEEIMSDFFGKKHNIEIIAGINKETVLLVPVGIEESIRQIPEAALFVLDLFRGVFISSQGMPIPVINTSLLMEDREKFIWL